MKVLCLGNNSKDTDIQTTQLAKQVDQVSYGLVTNVDTRIDEGFYHTSIFDLTHDQILTLIKQFDSLILLNQPIEQWTHPDAFYLTMKVIDDAKDIIQVTRLMQDNGIKFFEKLVESNKSFCIFPFIELLINGNGVTTLCCNSGTEITKLKKISNWNTDSNYKIIRDKMLAGELLEEHCSTCYRYERQGIKSSRQQDTVEWANRLNLKSLDDLNNIKDPVYYEVFPANTCNLQCRSCSPSNSNLIEKEFIRLGLHDPKVTFEYNGFDFVKINNIKKLYVAGGEPTAIIDLYDFMQKCIDENQTKFNFIINTNANKINDKFLDLCSQFQNLEFIVSVDGYKKINDYVRWLSDWDRVIANAKKLNSKHLICFNVVVSIYTINSLDKLLEYLDAEFPTAVVHCAFPEFTNDILNPDLFPDRDGLLEKLDKIKNLNCYKNNQLLKSFINGLIEKYSVDKTINLEKLKLFFEFNDKLDTSRNVRLKDYIPELDKFRSMVL